MPRCRSCVATCNAVVALLLCSIVAAVAAEAPSQVTHLVEHRSSGELMYRGQVYTKADSPVVPFTSSRLRESSHACQDESYVTYACDPTKFIGAVGSVMLLVVLAGAMSGLTVGVLSLDTMHLSVLKMEGSTAARHAAARLLPVLTHHRLLLVTLVFMNALANEALPIFLNTLINPVASVVFSVTFVVLFGEIVPTALCTGDRQLVIGAACVPLLRVLIRLTYPISYPISVFLNHTVGETASNLAYSRDELKALVQLQHLHNPRAGLTADDVDLLQCVLDLGKRSVRDYMTSVVAITDVAPPDDVPLGSHLLHIQSPDDSVAPTTLVYAHGTGLYPVTNGVCGGTLPYVEVEPATSLSSLLATFLRHPTATIVVVVTLSTTKADKVVVGIVRRQDVPFLERQVVPRDDLHLAIDDTTDTSSNESTSPTMAPIRPPQFFAPPNKGGAVAYARVSIVDDMEVFPVAATCS
ncbi:hypothetical protein H310_03836 [Aphanomyces invadans]|uniref:CNNM transmembrane domain-containing protein n=1 Tax=Aphanomyces invadans TaxID=157072 RepID=A0A024UFK0_9STRA|nr:hypothetical protein H310_03836 [Aphanomyces invadans]ETW04672.1 hypothetical protein H310_03836 [Aphanomyces invadans]|eukprot:XP_008866110.1 hypothetical protein H310_03836 [Aphanomyces invadans]